MREGGEEENMFFMWGREERETSKLISIRRVAIT
jgi:hypothetical protein